MFKSHKKDLKPDGGIFREDADEPDSFDALAVSNDKLAVRASLLSTSSWP